MGRDQSISINSPKVRKRKLHTFTLLELNKKDDIELQYNIGIKLSYSMVRSNNTYFF